MDKDTKYDRQLRLWAQDGQTRLEKSRVCLVNATSTGLEILKNLVLPGIGLFTIVDHRIVEQDDLSGNFFLQEQDVGSSISQIMCASLMELNPDVLGESVEQSLESLEHDPEFWNRFNAVIVSEAVSSLLLLRLKQLLWDKGIPLLIVSTCGFYGTLHIVNKETTIVETHDPSKLFDLRIDCPWPELQQYSDSFVMDELDDTEHAHVPYIVIFLKALRQWKVHHEGNPPLNYQEKKQFRSEYVEGMSRDIRTETNFIEASQSIHRALQTTSVPGSIEKLFETCNQTEPTGSTTLFWLYVRALQEFVETHQAMPLPGNLPDMASKTSNYVTLQKIFREKALSDQQDFKQILQSIYEQIGRPETELNDESIATFCKNAAFLFVSHGNPFAFSDSLKRDVLRGENSGTLAIHFGLLALHQWVEVGKPEGFDSYLSCFKKILSVDDAQIPLSVLDTLRELFAHQTSSYHNISSYMGGIAAQEVLKIITEQYIPLDNLYVFDGIRSVSSKWKV